MPSVQSQAPGTGGGTVYGSICTAFPLTLSPSFWTRKQRVTEFLQSEPTGMGWGLVRKSQGSGGSRSVSPCPGAHVSLAPSMVARFQKKGGEGRSLFPGHPGAHNCEARWRPADLLPGREAGRCLAWKLSWKRRRP